MLRRILGFIGVGLCGLALLILPKISEINISDFVTQVAVAIFVLGVGIAYWTFKNDIDSLITSGKNSKKYNAKFLNENVFRKLMRVNYANDYKYRLIFQIPTDEKAFGYRNGNLYAMWINDEIIGEQKAIERISVDHAMPYLSIGEKYLKSNYVEIYKKWIEIKQKIDLHNAEREEFKNYLGQLCVNNLTKEYSTFIESIKAGNDLNDVYFIERIKDVLFSTMWHSSDNENPADYLKRMNIYTRDNFWILQHGWYPILISKDKEKIAIEKICNLFLNIINNNDVTKRFKESCRIDPSLYDMLESFKEKLEDDVVHDIDAFESSSM